MSQEKNNLADALKKLEELRDQGILTESEFLQKESEIKKRMKNTNVEEALKKLRELVDMGILTQEEFAKKESELLGRQEPLQTDSAVANTVETASTQPMEINDPVGDLFEEPTSAQPMEISDPVGDLFEEPPSPQSISNETEEISSSAIEFRGVQIPQVEIGALQNLEYVTGKEFTVIDEINENTQMGFFVKDNRVTKLGVSRCELEKVPDSIGELKWLEILSLKDNKLTALPDTIGQLSKLETLNLSFNQLTTLPKSFTNLLQLQYLDIRLNKLKSLPMNMGNLKLLKSLDIHQNNMKTLPISFTKLDNIIQFIANDNPFAQKRDSTVKKILKFFTKNDAMIQI